MSAAIERGFEESTGPRTGTQLLLGVVGPSGSGKTESSLRLATGIQRVSGGEIYVLDSENKRARHYEDKYRFHHVPFAAPFSPNDYQAGIEYCRKKGAKIVVIDSTSHLHEGKGGVLEWHAREVERIMAAWRCTEEKANIPAWNKPKTALRAFIDYFTQIDCHLIFCFKARDKIKIGNGKVATLGFMPIASEELVFELTAKVLLLPGADGVPTLQSNETGEKMMIKLPGYLRPIFTGAAGKPLDESVGEQLAMWAGGASTATPPTIADYDACTDRAAFDALEKRRADAWKSMPAAAKNPLKAAADAAKSRLTAGTDAATKNVQADLVGDQRQPYTAESATAALRACQDDATRANVWKDVQRDFEAAGKEVPLDVEAANQEMKESFAL
jgi:energy-coupling factor transporter ATP-binding protein EcfA2